MNKRLVLLTATLASLGFSGLALADMPLMNAAADKVIQKYQTSHLRAAVGAEAGSEVRAGAARHRPAEERSTAAHRLPEQDCRADLEQDVRVRDDPLKIEPLCVAAAGGTPDWRFLR